MAEQEYGICNGDGREDSRGVCESELYGGGRNPTDDGSDAIADDDRGGAGHNGSGKNANSIRTKATMSECGQHAEKDKRRQGDERQSQQIEQEGRWHSRAALYVQPTDSAEESVIAQVPAAPAVADPTAR